MKKVQSINTAPAIGPYSPGIISNKMVFVSGQIGIDNQTGEMKGNSIEEQAVAALENLSAVLAAAGTSIEHVVKTTCFLADINDFSEFNEIYGRFFTTCKPARSCFSVKDLPRRALVEVEAIAEMPDAE